jgi:hypothetical protein
MSYFGRMEDAKKDCAAADIQIDGNSPENTSPVLHGGSSAGMAPMQGANSFSHSRTRPNWKPNRTSMRREYPSEGVSGGSAK